ncbi:MAG: DUF115 domain-containing protein [Spirochaeta sp.]|nr:DUF115 domain-containing protein [Spirochaeta sp.]
MLEIIPTKTNLSTAVIDGQALHSRYDPLKESQRFVKNSLSSEYPAAVIFLGAGLGYTASLIKETFPQAKLICIYYSADIFKESKRTPWLYWFPGAETTLLSFLRLNLKELELEGLSILKWAPCERIFPEMAKTAATALQQVLKELRGSLVTTLVMGRHWIQNSFINFLSIERIITPSSDKYDLPIFLAGSGPSLEQAATLLHRYRNKLIVWALPSAIPYLIQMDITPDLVIITDPSFYAGYHLYPLFNKSINLATPLSAVHCSRQIKGGVLLISQSNFFEEDLLNRLNIRIPRIPPQGTVAATALQLALKYTSREIILAGLDFSYSDIHSHVRPNAFDNFLIPSVNRLSPLYSKLYSLAAQRAPFIKRTVQGSFRTGLTMDTYCGWFAALPDHISARIFRLNPSPVKLDNLKTVDTKKLAKELGKRSPRPGTNIFIPVENYPDRNQRRQTCRDLLTGWHDHLNTAVKRTKKVSKIGSFLNDPFLLTFSYYYDPGSLAKIKKTLRLTGESEAVLQALSLLAREKDFIESITARLELRESYV